MFQGSLGQIETSRCMIVASKIGNAMHSGQQTPRLQKVRIARESFIKKLGCFRQLLSCMDSIGCIGKQRLRAQVKIVRDKIHGGGFFDRRLFAQGHLCLELVRDLLGNLTLNGEYVR